MNVVIKLLIYGTLAVFVCGCIVLIFHNVSQDVYPSKEAYGVVSEGAGRYRRKTCRVLPAAGEWQAPEVPSWMQGVNQRSPDLAKYICIGWLLEPSRANYKLIDRRVVYHSQHDQDRFVDKLLNNRTNGFFIECGAAKGEKLSNTLYFEKSRNWSGILIEANPVMFRHVLSKHRKAHSINCCLSPQIVSMNTTFEQVGLFGGLNEYMSTGHHKDIDNKLRTKPELVTVQCFPLFSILQALGVTHIDYFSLDIEGAELDVLYTLPLDIITVDVFSIEYVISESPEATEQKFMAITKYLADVHRYNVVRQYGKDVILQRDV